MITKLVIFLGIDPGTASVGFGVIKKENEDLKMLDFGVIRTYPSKKEAVRLGEIHKGLKKIIKKYKPDRVSVEDVYFYKNSKTAIKVGQARGVILFTIEHCKKPYSDYTPLQVKQAVTGYGRAEKTQVQKMVQQILKLDDLPKPDDAADALAIAICDIYSAKINKFK